MKKYLLGLTVVAAALIPLSVFAAMTSCSNLFWFDTASGNQCQTQKQFCGAFMYYGLQTFGNQLDCLNAFNATKASCTPSWKCDWGTCINGYQSQTAVDSNHCGAVNGPIACPALARQCTSSTRSSVPSAVYTVPELGIQFPIPSDLSDLVYYVLRDNGTAGKDVRFSSKSLIQADQNTGGHYCTADQGPIGRIHVNTLGPISYVHAQATCSDNPSVQNIQTRLSNLLKQAVQSATLMSASNGKIPPAGFEDKVLTNIETYRNPFPDTDMTRLPGKAAAELYRRAIIGGFPDGQFKGGQPVNRAEAAKFFLLARFGTVDDMANSGTFPDVLDGQWYTKFVMTAAQKGIINGYPDGTFRPGDQVNTAEFLKMLTLTFGLQLNIPNAYSDISANAWFAQYAGIANKYTLFPGRSASLRPGSVLSRQDVAVAIYQYLSKR